MTASTSLTTVTDANLVGFLATDWAVLILSTSDCGYCAAYQREIDACQEQGLFDGISVGKLVLNEPGVSQFKRDNRWIANLAFLPHSLVYLRGQLIDSFSTSKGSYLLERLEDNLSVHA